MATHGSLGEFDPRTRDWKTYVERAKQYFLANDVNAEDKQRAILLSAVGDKAYSIIKDIVSPDALTEVALKTLIEKATKHFQPEPSEIVQWFRFHTHVRESHESVATFIAQLKQLAESCNFGDTERVNEMLRDRLVCGVANEKWQQRLLAEEGLTYETTTKLLLSLEAAEKELKDLSGDASKKLHYTQRRSITRGTSKTPANSRVESCKHCGRAHDPASCGFNNAKCFFCHKRGHIAAVCRQKSRRAGPSKKKTNLVDSEEKPTSPPEYADPMKNISSVHSSAKKKPYIVNLMLQGKTMQMEVDTGVTLSIMTHDTYRSMWEKSQAPAIKTSTANLCTYTGQRLNVVCVVEVNVQYNDQNATLSLVIVEGQGPSLLGRDWLSIIQLDWSQFNKVHAKG